MRILHSYWTKNIENRSPNGGWLSQESNIMSWSLSCLNAIKYFGNIELYSDEIGIETLCRQFHLPYTHVHNTFDDDKCINTLPHFLWSIPKIRTYSLQTEPFVHIDGDFILWSYIDFAKPLIFQNIEINVPLYEKMYNKLKAEIIHDNTPFINCLTDAFKPAAANMGAFGGTNISFIKDYSTHALEFSIANSNKQSFVTNKQDINCFVEQYYMLYLCNKNGINYSTLHTPADMNDIMLSSKCTYNYPTKQSGFNHFLGASKRQELMCDYVKHELFLNHRSYYELIHDIYGDNSMSLHYFNTKNKQLSIQNIHHDMIARLKDKNVILDKELEREYLEFLQYKQKCLSHADGLISECDRKDFLYITKINEKTQVCLNDCYIDCLYYTLPWDEIYKTDDIIKESQVTIYKKDSVNSSRHYALFLYTPFDHSLYTVFINNICAYVIQNVLKREIQTVSSVANGINRLLRSESKSYEKALEFAISIISKLNTYGIIKFID